MEEAFEKYCILLKQLHSLIALDKDDSEEGDKVLDEMDICWYKMTKEEREKVNKIKTNSKKE